MKIREAFTNNLSYKLLSLLIALGLWFIVRDERVEGKVELPVEVTAPENLVVASEPPDRLTVSVTGTRFALDRLKNIELSPYEVLPRSDEPGTMEVRVRPEDIHLPGDVKVSEVTPSRFDLLMERKAQREFPVRVRLLGRPAPGYTVGSPIVKPERVKVVGATSLIRDLDWVYTEPVSIEGRRQTFRGEYALSLPSSQVWPADHVRVSVEVPIIPEPTPTPSPDETQVPEEPGATPTAAP